MKILLTLLIFISLNAYSLPDKVSTEECMMQCLEARVLSLKLIEHKILEIKFKKLCKEINLENFQEFMRAIKEKYFVYQWSQSVRGLCGKLEDNIDYNFKSCVKECKNNI